MTDKPDANSQGNENLHYVADALGKVALGEFSAEELRVLATINQKIAAAPDLRRLMEYLFESTRTIFPCDRLSLAFFEEDGNRLILRSSVASYRPLLLTVGYSEDLMGSSLERVLSDGVPRIINDLPAYLEAHPDSRSTKLLVEEGVRSSMTCPLVLGRRVVGVLFRNSRKSGTYSDRDARKQRAITERLAQAVEKTRKIELLQESEEAYNKMVDFVALEIKERLGDMVERLYGLTADENVPEELRERLGNALQPGLQLDALLEEFAQLRRLDRDEVSFTVDDEADCEQHILLPAMDQIRSQLDARGMEMEAHLPQDPKPIACDPRLLTTVVKILLDNAVKYGARGGLVRISWQQTAENFSIKVYNDGHGFAPEQRHRLFHRFVRGAEARQNASPGTGLGLYTAWRIVTMHGGRMSAESEPGQWAEFAFTIPQPLVPKRKAVE